MRSADVIYGSRRRARLTQAELARRLGIPQSQVSRWERGIAAPSFETLQRIVRACCLELTIGLANRDDSYAAFVARALDHTPAERIADAVAREREYEAIRSAAVG
ncbi:MAG: helix-turn-helix domain-containing protein [Gaiella sp.]|nr:helix-turn-helix domain-containing protein [Gaiella sp.]